MDSVPKLETQEKRQRRNKLAVNAVCHPKENQRPRKEKVMGWLRCLQRNKRNKCGMLWAGESWVIGVKKSLGWGNIGYTTPPKQQILKQYPAEPTKFDNFFISSFSPLQPQAQRILLRIEQICFRLAFWLKQCNLREKWRTRIDYYRLQKAFQ